MTASEEIAMDLDLEEMEAISGEAENLMAEIEPQEEVTPEPAACAYLRSQLEVGLTPEQVVAAAAAVRSVAANKRLLMQASDDHSKMTMMYKEGSWVGNDINQSVSTTPLTTSTCPVRFPFQNKDLECWLRRK